MQISGGFSLFNSLDDAIYLAYAQVLIPVRRIHQQLDFFMAFPDLAKVVMKFWLSS
jgi:hypothetical protein